LAKTRVINDLLLKVYFIASLILRGSSTFVNSGRSLNLNVVYNIKRVPTIPTAIMAICRGNIPCSFRKKSGIRNPKIIPIRLKNEANTDNLFLSCSSSVISGGSAEYIRNTIV
jgi:hypothetical protein